MTTVAVLFAVAAPAAQAGAVRLRDELARQEVAQYDVGAGGLLTPLSPFTVDAVGRWPDNVAISPDRKSVYVGNSGQLCDCPGDEPGSIAQYDVNADGTLSPKTPAKVKSCGSTAHQVAVSPNGRSVYVAGGADCTSRFPIRRRRGRDALAQESGLLWLGDDFGQTIGVAVSPDSQSVYVTNATFDGRVYQYDVGRGRESRPKSPASVAAGDSPLAWRWPGRPERLCHQRYATPLPGTVSQYDVGAGGKLIPKSPPRSQLVATRGTWP